jgi:hypothetical protein
MMRGKWIVMAFLFCLLFALITVFRVSGDFTHYDLRIVARLVPARDHTRVLALIHPLVHLGDVAAIAMFSGAAIVCLWLLGYRRTWAMLTVLLSWPIEFACKSILPQPAGLGSVQATVSITSLVHGTGARTISGWLQHAAPGATLNLISTYPSGTTARGTFVLGLLLWLSLRAEIPVISELCALSLLAALSVLGLAMVLYSWHWPSEVLGGYALGFALLAITLAAIRHPLPAP